MRLHRSLTVLAVLASFAVGCADEADGGSGGDDALSDDAQEYAEAWAVSLRDEEDDLAVTEAEAACMGESIMLVLGVAPFEDAGVEPADVNGDDDDESPGELLGEGVVSEEQADEVIDRWEGCADMSDAFATQIAGDFDLDDEGIECLATGLDENDLLRRAYRTSFTSGDDEPSDEVLTELLDVIDGCGPEGGGGTDAALVESMAEELASDGSLTADEAECLAQGMLDTLGRDRLIELSSGNLDDASAEVQAEVSGAVIAAAGDCGIPISELGG